MQFKYNDLIYEFPNSESLDQTLNRKDVLSFPLHVWKELLDKRYGRADERHLLKILKAKIQDYDTSDNVNSFVMGGKKLWLDKNTRVGLMHLANCSTSALQLVLDGTVMSFSPDFVKEFLAKLEVYAGQCYLQTQLHLMQVSNLTTIEEMINYDYTTGYPEKITLE